MDNRGLPASWREMQGYGWHTYQWTNAEDERCWVRYRFRSSQWVNSMTGEAAEALAGADGDFYIRDLQENIAAGNFPYWGLHVQVMPYEDAKTYRFNPFDLNKGVAARGLPAGQGSAPWS